MVPESLIYQAKNIITSAGRVCLAMHERPDPDAAGSAAALAHWCLALGKPCVLFSLTDSALARQYAPPGVEFVFDGNRLPRDIGAIVTVDSGDIVFSGAQAVINAMPSRPAIINIDHHKTNTRFGDCNLIAEQASSATEIVFKFLKICGARISREMAECLLIGLLADTHGFTNPAATSESLKAAGELVLLGADPTRLQKRLFHNQSLDSLRALGGILRDSGLSKSWQVAYAVSQGSHTLDKVSGLSNLFNALGEGKAAFIIKAREDGKIHCSMRTTRSDVDLGKLAQYLGGGGHAKAAGFTIKGKFVSMGEGQYRII